jgi:hypothetical protein
MKDARADRRLPSIGFSFTSSGFLVMIAVLIAILSCMKMKYEYPLLASASLPYIISYISTWKLTVCPVAILRQRQKIFLRNERLLMRYGFLEYQTKL